MTAPPLPASPALRVRLICNQGSVGLQGSRFFVTYAGGPPSGDNCNTLASGIAAAWASELSPVISSDFALTEVDVLDIATDSGYSGQWSGLNTGGDGAPSLPIVASVNIEYGIARRYRGGKPRMFLPAPAASRMDGFVNLTTAYVDDVNAQVAAFFASVATLSAGSTSTLTHVNLSYYKGFTNIENSSGRERAVPTYRDTALVDVVTGYFCKAELSTQRRRRTATTP